MTAAVLTHPHSAPPRRPVAAASVRDAVKSYRTGGATVLALDHLSVDFELGSGDIETLEGIAG